MPVIHRLVREARTVDKPGCGTDCSDERLAQPAYPPSCLCASPQNCAQPAAVTRLHLHLLSDSTGETLEAIAKAALALFDDVEPIRHFWPMVRSEGHLARIMGDIGKNPGLILFTLANTQLRG